jgi:NAD(P)-dependent dehydrogenase (short-subunit alcohol dehydrogenase family)
LEIKMGVYALTGSASGIGAALKTALSNDGHSIISVDIKDADIIADLTTPGGRKTAVDAILAMAPEGLDGLVPLAGLGAGTAPDLLITKLNYFGTVELVNGLRPALKKKKGAIVLLCSNSVPMIPPDEEFLQALLSGDEEKSLALAEDKVAAGTHYMLTKRALNYWMRSNVMSYAGEGIRMNAIAPGPTITPMTKPLFESEDYGPIMQALLEQTPAARAGEAEEIAACIMFLLSPAASYVYGTCLWADGGYDAHTRQEHI